MTKMGRPEKPIDWKIFEDLCHIQCTHDELASVCHVAKSTLYERAQKHYGEDFPTVYKRYSEGGKASLRRTQFKMSQKNATMAIWLGKQYLGQKDNAEQYQFDEKTLDQFQSLMNLIANTQASASSNIASNIALSNISNAEKS
jgi:hypothetical protein